MKDTDAEALRLEWMHFDMGEISPVEMEQAIDEAADAIEERDTEINRLRALVGSLARVMGAALTPTPTTARRCDVTEHPRAATTWRRLMLRIEPQVASQRFAFAAENIGPVPWRWVLVIDGDVDVAWGQASFKATAVIKGTIARIVEWRAFAMEERTRQRVERRAENGSSRHPRD